MNKFTLFCFLTILLCISGYSQEKAKNNFIRVQATVLSEKDKLPLSFANVYNISNKVGAISNYDGYFEISIQSFEDSIIVSYIGYKPLTIPLKKGKTSYQLLLEESAQMLKTIEIRPKNYDPLFDLIIACRRKHNNQIHQSKAYFQLKSQINNEQIELIENFYNAKIRGYNLERLSLKTGRAGLRKTMNQQIFMSLESSRAIAMHNLFDIKPWFPIQPLNEVKRRLKKNFNVNLISKYQDDTADTILHLELEPKRNPSRYFKTKLWINKNDEHIIKVMYEGNGLSKHPFLPYHALDTLKNMNIQIVKTFKEVNHHMILDHIDFNYQFKYSAYHSNKLDDLRQIKGYKNFNVKTKAVIKFYESDTLFNIPFFQYPTVAILNDYAKINAFPFNNFFWDNHNELIMNDKIDSNSIFLNDSRTYNNKRIFSRSKNIGYGFFTQPYINWSGSRIIFKPHNEEKGLSQLDEYRLKAKIFLDYNQYSDSIHILTKTVLDPYETYYKPELDTLSHCFINIYFDLIEAERRKLEREIEKSDRSYSTIKRLYNQKLKEIDALEKDYFAEVFRGKNYESLEYYNDLVHKELNIDNINLFKLSPP